MTDPAAGPTPAPASGLAAAPNRAQLGGRYTPLEAIGEGGSAVVYRAQDETLGREVALKLLHPHIHPQDRRRFEREIRTLARLSHPGVITVHDIGEAEGGGLFFTMPLLTGGALSTLGPLEDHPEVGGRYFAAAISAARALDYVHRQGLIHRDLTPGNIMLGGDGEPRIMDFGLVATSDFTRQLTRSGVTLGTPQYMSPEQTRGAGVGPASDLYALGAVLYRVACGSPPFVGDSDQSILFQHVYEPLPDPASLNPAVTPALAAVLGALLAKQPRDRPASAGQAAQLLEAAWTEARRHWAGNYRGGLTRSGVTVGGPAAPARLSVHWELELPGEVTWPSAVTGNGEWLSVGTRSGQLALVSVSGSTLVGPTVRDEVTAPATFDSQPVNRSAAGPQLLPRLLYGAWDGALRSVLPGSPGAPGWTHQTRAEITAAPVRWGERVLVSSRDGHLHAVSAASGELLWAYRAGSPVAASPLVWGGAAIIGDEDGWLHAIDAGSGSLLWKVELGTIHATPALAPGPSGQATLIVPTWNGELHALALSMAGGRVRAAGELLWSYDVEDELWAAPAVQGGRVVVAGWSGQVRALTLSGGDDLWSRSLGGRVTASPVIADGLVYLASETGTLCALALETGDVKWERREAEGVQATPLVMGGALYVATMNGLLRAYR